VFSETNYSDQNVLGETYSKVRTGKNLSDAFPIQNVLKQTDAV
jgi:hypothetical protein